MLRPLSASASYIYGSAVTTGTWSPSATSRGCTPTSPVGSPRLQLHGGVGFTWAFDCHLYLKRASLNQALVAPNVRQIDDAAARLEAATRSGRSALEMTL